ncbi:MAG: InlB B-repeat-containing protein [Candidatus Dojkabacteria bacterium]|jgi:hypothetical protein
MADVKFASKKVIAIFVVFLLLFGGAGGYLLWRINQEKTVSPTDSDAMLCVDLHKVITVDIYPFLKMSSSESNEMGYVEEVKEPNLVDKYAVRPVENVQGRHLRFVLKNVCSYGSKVRAVAKPGYKFSHWEEQSGDGVIESGGNSMQSNEITPITEPNVYTQNPIQVKAELASLKLGYVVRKDNVRLTAKFVPDTGSDCKEVSVVYEGLKSAEGSLTILKKVGNVVEKNNTIIQSFTKPDEIGSQIKAVPASGYKFKHWENAVYGQIESTSAIIQKDAKDLFGDKTCMENAFSLVLKPVYEKTEADIGPDKQAKVIYQASPTECSKLIVCAPSGKPRLNSVNCLEQVAIPNTNVEPVMIDTSLDKTCIFQHWLVNGVQDSYTGLERQDRTGEAGTVKTITAVFKKETTTPTEQTYSLRYSTEGNGKLSRDNGTQSSNTISTTVKEGGSGPTIKVFPNEGYVFAYWIDNTTREKDTSALATANPRQDTDVKSNISLTAHYEKEGGTTPPEGDGTTPPEGDGTTPPAGDGTTPPAGDGTGTGGTGTGTGGTGTGTSGTGKDGLPGTSASPEDSLYIIVVGTLILSIGMLLPYLPSKINLKKKER